ncbi:MAG TPA: hypothetical protein VFX13_10625 [Gaiellales bacterium]|nr:hypothetical protein [Gaiellales bacterium]
MCLRPARDSGCVEHGPWAPHQLATIDDRRAAGRGSWLPFEPLMHACPRCLGEVAEGRHGWECVESAHGRDPHGPYQVDELLGIAGQRDGAACRERFARRARVRQRSGPQLPALPAIDAARLWRLIAAATVLAATVAFLSR